MLAEEQEKEQKPVIPQVPAKSSMEILSELFNSFDAEPPLIIKREKIDSSDKKPKKSKKKHKHKDKKHKKKVKKRRRSSSSSSNRSEIDLAEILIKQEKGTSEQKIKIEGTDLSFSIDKIKTEKGVKEQKIDSEKHKNKDKDKDGSKDKRNGENSVKKIEIKLTTASLEQINNEEAMLESDVSDSDEKKKKKRKKHKRDYDKPKKIKKEKDEGRSKDARKERNKSEELQLKIDDLRNKLRANHENLEVQSKSRENRHRSRSREHRHKDDRDRYKESDHRSRRDSSFYKEREDDFRLRDRYRGHRSRNRDRDDRGRHRSSSRIDKKKLLEIARKNAIQMMKSGSLPGALTLGPQAQEKVIAAIKAGGKTIEELTDFCKTLSKKEALGELSSNSDGSDSDTDKPFHHPFQLKDRPTSITMNIRNSVPLPIKSTVERTSELRLQFPVSSGQLHRKTESEWVPISKKKSSLASQKVTSATPLAIAAPPTSESVAIDTSTAQPGPQVFPPIVPTPDGDIGSIVSQRLTALRKLQENPNDVQALTEMYRSNKEMQSWAQSKQQPGQFTGSTGANIMSAAELSSGYQAWAKKDQLLSASPVSGGMGMHLLQKMGWKPGEGLGKEKSGALEPLLLEVKLDKKGLVANEEQKKRKKQGQPQYNSYSLQSKHPVSLLGEYASKKKLGAPQYNLCFECGPDHKKNFLFKVVLNGVEYQPNVASPNKKEAKAAAASVCLQSLGLTLVPTTK